MTTDEFRRESIRLFMEKADEALRAAHQIRETSPSTAVSRSYYACFYAASAVLLVEGRKFVKHATLRGALHKLLVRTGRFSKGLAAEYGKLLVARHQADYEATIQWSPSDVDQAIRAAETVVAALRELLPPADSEGNP